MSFAGITVSGMAELVAEDTALLKVAQLFVNDYGSSRVKIEAAKAICQWTFMNSDTNVRGFFEEVSIPVPLPCGGLVKRTQS